MSELEEWITGNLEYLANKHGSEYYRGVIDCLNACLDIIQPKWVIGHPENCCKTTPCTDDCPDKFLDSCCLCNTGIKRGLLVSHVVERFYTERGRKKMHSYNGNNPIPHPKN